METWFIESRRGPGATAGLRPRRSRSSSGRSNGRGERSWWAQPARLDGTRAGSAPRLTRERFLGDFSIEIQQKTAAQLLDVARDAGATFEWGPSGVSVRVPCPLRTQPVTVAWLYSPSTSEKGWMKTRAFTFGTAILDSDPDERLRAVLQRWVGQFEGDPFADASSKGVQARSIDHAEAVGQVDRLTALLTDVISEIRSLGAR